MQFIALVVQQHAMLMSLLRINLFPQQHMYLTD